MSPTGTERRIASLKRGVVRLWTRLGRFGERFQVAELFGWDRLDATVFPDDDGRAGETSSLHYSGGCNAECGIRFRGEVVMRELVCHD